MSVPASDNTDRMFNDLQRTLDGLPIYFNGRTYERRTATYRGRQLIREEDVVLLDDMHIPHLVNAILDAGTSEHRFVLTSEAYVGTRGSDIILRLADLTKRLYAVYRPARRRAEQQDTLTFMDVPAQPAAAPEPPQPAPPTGIPIRERAIDLS